MTQTLELDAAARAALWARVSEAVERYATTLPTLPVNGPHDPRAVREFAQRIDFGAPVSPLDALEHAIEGLTRFHLHTAHPRYFGLFNPTPSAMGVAADAIVAAFNPQLAAWAHAPFAVEIERHVLRSLGARLGYDASSIDGAFTSGGAEANHTAVVAALVRAFPSFAREGVRALDGQPTLYVSAESHHSFVKAARACGLGTNAVRRIPVDDALRMRPELLADAIARDRADGCLPVLVAATLGTTSAGAVDDLDAIGDVTERDGLWLHADAAWGGAMALVSALRPALGNVARADSLTIDAHKGLSVPMAAGMFLTRHAHAMPTAFAISAAYVPPPGADDVVDPYAQSMQWSRRFIGLKLWLTLAVAGWDGYAAALRHQAAMADLLREQLVDNGWRIANDTPFPVVCFDDPDGADVDAIARDIANGGEAWISATRIGDGRAVLRACITSYRTTPDDVATLVRALTTSRAASTTPCRLQATARG